MALRIYRIAELIAAGKAQVRSAISNVGTEDGSDLALLIHVAARLFQGTQVAAKYVYDQLLPSTADATNRERMISYHGISLEKEATKARGLLLLIGEQSTVVPKGTTIAMPATAFADGVARSYVLLEDAAFRASSAAYTMAIRAGSTEWKVRAQNTVDAPNLHGIAAKEAIRLSYGGGVNEINAVKRVNEDDQTIELYRPMIAKPVVGETFTNNWTEGGISVTGVVVSAECTVAGKSGNASSGFSPFTGQAYRSVTVIEMAGGGDAVVGTDADEARQIRMIEDTAAGAPGLGNMAHWREIAIACPDVDLDDAVVYQHARGPGTIDIVAIGRKQHIVPKNFPEARTDFTHGLNGRRIGEVQAAKVEAWCKSFASYHDDIKVRSVEYEYTGEDPDNDIWNTSEFFRSVPDLTITISAQEGYGPDCGSALPPIVPHITHTSGGNVKLYSSGASTQLSSLLAPGQRVWVRLRPTNTGLTATRAPVLTVVTTILSVDKGRLYVTVADLDKVDAGDGVSGAAGIFYASKILDWGVAGPLTQPVLDAVYDYYDQLGPGSYLDPPKGPTYLRQFHTGSGNIAPYSGVAISRWPPDGRRWTAGFRGSELLSKLLSIKGVKSVTMDLAEFDPLPFHTLALRSVIPRY